MNLAFILTTNKYGNFKENIHDKEFYWMA